MVFTFAQQLSSFILTMKKTSISFYTLGCRLNQSETSAIEHSIAIDNYFKIVKFQDPSDIVVINTCTVTAKGDTDTKRLINKINKINPKSQIALIGCQAEIQKKNLTTLKGVKWVIGNAKKNDLAAILKKPNPTGQPVVLIKPIPRKSFTIPFTGIDRKKTRANIKIQDGCDFFCSFCEIPYARGRSRSREFQDIIKEASDLTRAGYKELILTGINIGTYKEGPYTLIDVIKALEQITELKRVRISSVEYTTIGKNFLDMMAQSSKICRYLHLPLQSADNDVLKSMNRKYTYEEFNNFVNTAHSKIPNICIGTDIIVGFPTETNLNFNNTFNHLKKSPINYFHVFSYSKRNLAKSKTMPHAIDSKEIWQRSNVLRQLSYEKRTKFYDSFKGSTQSVLFEQKKGAQWVGLTDNYIKVHSSSDEDLTNQIRGVKLISVQDEKIFGKIQLS